ncbi:MAG: class I SAM-dependent methyltransferase, partial [Ilumatobacteraceae bacterium]
MRPADAEDSVYYHNDESGSKILVHIFGNDLGRAVPEVGAGAGYVTQELANFSDSVATIEPNQVLFTQLQARVAHLSNVAVLNMTLDEFMQPTRGSIDGGRQFDSVVHINVLEHIDGDARELSRARKVLAPSGRILIVVPAHRWLYSKVDQLSGHFRRYSKSSHRSTHRQAHLRPSKLVYSGSVGMLPYLVIYKWLRSTAVAGTNAVVYSRVVLP